MKKTTQIFVVIVVAQFCGTSLWFAGNAVLPQLQRDFGWLPSHIGYLTSAIQLGFISGTLIFSLIGISDKYSPSKVFLISAILAAFSNAICLIDLASFPFVMTSRFLTGFFLAGVYPVGMKIASDWTEKGLGLWLGALVGALVLGTAFPNLLNEFAVFLHPTKMLIAVSLLAIAGGFLLFYFVPNGPYRKTGWTFSFSNVTEAFRVARFRKAAFGYFGHMWELYAFWAFVPFMINVYLYDHVLFPMSLTLTTFITIGAGAVGCLAGGFISKRAGSHTVAQYMLIASGTCCFISYFFQALPPAGFLFFLCIWGFAVAGDSPQFSTLVASNARPEVRGSAITMVTCIGFFISILSIQLLNSIADLMATKYLFLLLAPGPIIGLIGMNGEKSDD